MSPRFRLTSPPSLGLIGAGVLTCAAVAGAAVAAQPTGAVVNACASKATGALRVIDASKKGTAGKCRSSERDIIWGLNGPTGNTGAAGPAGPGGPAGAAGAAGAAGPVGAGGATGAQGVTGASGSSAGGVVGPTGPPGLKGATGPVTDISPSGLTQVGVVSARSYTASSSTLEADINFPLRIDGGVAEHLVPANTTTTDCPGSAATPTAAQGHLCVYVSKALGVTSGTFADPVSSLGLQSQSQPYGTIVRYTAAAGDSSFYGVWAVNAP